MSQDAQKIIRLYEFYVGNCPECHNEFVLAPSNLQRTGQKNLQVANCPFCNAGIEGVIASKEDNTLVAADLSKYKHYETVKESEMIFRKAEGVVINPQMIQNPVNISDRCAMAETPTLEPVSTGTYVKIRVDNKKDMLWVEVLGVKDDNITARIAVPISEYKGIRHGSYVLFQRSQIQEIMSKPETTA